jgi:hypothetical protein
LGAFDDSNTLATRLQAVGYTTFRQYLNGYGRYPNTPTCRPRSPTYVPPGWTQWHATIDPNTRCEYDYDMNHNGAIQSYDLPPGVTKTMNLYQTNVIAALPKTSWRATSLTRHRSMSRSCRCPACGDLPGGYGGQPAPDDVFARRIRLRADRTRTQPLYLAAYDRTPRKLDYIAVLTPLTTEDFDNLSEKISGPRRDSTVDRLIRRVVAALGPPTIRSDLPRHGWLQAITGWARRYA